MSRGMTITQFAVFLMAMYFSCQFLNFLPFMSILLVGCLGLVIVLFRMVSDKFLYYFLSGGAIGSLSFVFYAMLIYYSLGLSNIYYHTIDNVIKYTLILLLFAAIMCETSDFRKKIWKMCLWGMFLTTVSTCINVLINPAILRVTASRAAKSAIFFGFGGYDFIYGLIFINILLIDAIYNTQKEKRGFYWTFLILSTFTISVSGYTTAFILNLAFLVVAFFFCGNAKKARWLLAIVPFASILPVAFSKFAVWISGFTIMPYIVRERVYDIGMSLVGSGELSYISGEGERFSRMLNSLNLIFEHPMFGNFLFNMDAEYGMHTEWLDRIAQYGLIPFLLIFVFWLQLYRMQKKLILASNKKTTALNICYIYFICLGFLNPATYPYTVFSLIFLPTLMAEFV